MQTITTDDIRKHLEDGTLAVFDARGDIEYDQGHLPGAKTAPPGSLPFRVRSLMNADTPVAVYSNGGNCPIAADAARRLEGLGMQKVLIYEDGVAGWTAAGHELIQSTHHKSHTHGDVKDVRPLTVDRDNAYGGAFNDKPNEDMGGAGG